MILLTCNADGGFATLGGAQMTPGHTQTPVVLWSVEVLHLLSGHIYHHFTDLQPCTERKKGRSKNKKKETRSTFYNGYSVCKSVLTKGSDAINLTVF